MLADYSSPSGNVNSGNDYNPGDEDDVKDEEGGCESAS